MMYLIQGIGLLALAFIILSYQQNNRRSILSCLLIAQLLWALHLGLLGAWTASIINIIAAVRSGVYMRWTSKLLLPVFISLFFITGAFTWAGAVSILPVLAQTVATFSYWMKEPQRIRMLTLIPRPLWFTYHLIVGSYAGIIAEIFMSTSLVTAIVRLDVLKRPEPIPDDE